MIQREISDNKLQMDSLDGLRGFAALIVVFGHTSNIGMLSLPYVDLSGSAKSGVFLFFVLSSFLLTLPLLRKGREVLSFPVMSHYWQRRFFRIYPLYTLYLLFAVLSTWFIATYLGISDLGTPFVLDWQGFFNHLALVEGKGVTWSIAVEFKFYFVLPFLVMLVVAARSLGPLATLLLFALLMLLSQVISPQSEALKNDARLLPYMPIFVIGIFLAVVQDSLNRRGLSRRGQALLKYAGYLALAAILVTTRSVWALFEEPVEKDYFHRQFILYALLWSCVLMSAVNVKGPLQWFFSLPLLRFYGALSFSLYLFHPMFIGAMNTIGVRGYAGFWIVLIGATVAAYISFRVLEGPVSKFKLDSSHLAPLAQIKGRIFGSK